MAQLNLDKAKDALVIALGLVLLLNIFLASGLNGLIGEKVALLKESVKPAKLQLTIIEDKTCKDCFDITATVDSIKRTNVEITKEEKLDFSSAKGLIKKYGIEKIPTIIVAGEINKTKFGDFEEKDGVLLFIKQTPLYTDAISGKVEGRVSLIHLKDGSCDKCTELSQIIDGLKKNVKIIDEKEVDINSSEGRSLISKYSIKQAPALILSKELSVYSVSEGWSNVGSIEEDGSYVMRGISPPYTNTSTNKVVGLVGLTMLTDKSCTECYDVTIHKQIIPQFGVASLGAEKTVDVSDGEGKALIKRYDIKLVPTIILSKDAEVYPALKQIWQKVGSVEDDGTYIFRKLSDLGVPYKDLTTGETVKQ